MLKGFVPVSVSVDDIKGVTLLCKALNAIRQKGAASGPKGPLTYP